MLVLIFLSLFEILSKTFERFSEVFSSLVLASGNNVLTCSLYDLAFSMWFLHSLVSFYKVNFSFGATLSHSRIHSLLSIWDSIIYLSGKASPKTFFSFPSSSSSSGASIFSAKSKFGSTSKSNSGSSSYYFLVSNFGYLKVKFFCFIALFIKRSNTVQTCSPEPVFNLIGGISHSSPIFFISI